MTDVKDNGTPMYVLLIIARELLRIYILGLWAMLLLSLFTGVSWTAVASAAGWLSVTLAPFMWGMLTSFVVDMTGVVTDDVLPVVKRGVAIAADGISWGARTGYQRAAGFIRNRINGGA